MHCTERKDFRVLARDQLEGKPFGRRLLFLRAKPLERSSKQPRNTTMKKTNNEVTLEPRITVEVVDGDGSGAPTEEKTGKAAEKESDPAGRSSETTNRADAGYLKDLKRASDLSKEVAKASSGHAKAGKPYPDDALKKIEEAKKGVVSDEKMDLGLQEAREVGKEGAL